MSLVAVDQANLPEMLARGAPAIQSECIQVSSKREDIKSDDKNGWGTRARGAAEELHFLRQVSRVGKTQNWKRGVA